MFLNWKFFEVDKMIHKKITIDRPNSVKTQTYY